ncbi:MAG: radical SAM family heme chaperone HemW [Bacteroidetes bacterium]|nr:MAG: radical SAM family heme chaperone HemW [Bacteroidota bacterium]
MQGLYIHIPFCKKACHYCDFHFSTSLAHKAPLVEALAAEIRLQKSYLPSPTLDTIYFGGGTPSLLEQEDLKKILEAVYQNFELSKTAEITLEANPDDVNKETVSMWKGSGINRLSIGIQSFFEEDLAWMNRAHNAEQAANCIDIALQSGIENITADLIYGYPQLSDTKWTKNIETMLSTGINHLSAYSLTVEPKTALAHKIKKGEPAPQSNQAARHFEMLMDAIAAAGWEHYEISNYCKPGNYAKHNTNYWKNQPYLGIGPSAHSYDTRKRTWNVSNNASYITSINAGTIPNEEELLSTDDLFNEYVMTGLRTQWGINTQYVEEKWGGSYVKHIVSEAESYIKNGQLIYSSNNLTLSREGKLLADYIASELFI